MPFAYWAIVLMTVGVTWIAGVYSLAFDGGAHIRLWQALAVLPVAYLLLVNLWTKWRSKRGQQLAGAVHLAMLAFAVTLVLMGKVPLSPEAWWRRVGAAAGAIACVHQLVLLRRGSRAEQALDGKVPVSALSEAERSELSMLASSFIDAARSERVFRELIAADATEPLFHVALGQALLSQQKYAEAISVLERAPVPPYSMALQLATGYFGLKDHERAAEHARRAVALAGNDEEREAAQGLLEVMERKS